MAPTRNVEPRLAGGLRYADCSAARPSPSPPAIACAGGAASEPYRLRAFLRGSVDAAERERRRAILPLLASADTHGLARSLALLEKASARHPEQARIWSDYAAGLLLRRRAGGSGFDLFQALEAVEHAVHLDRSFAEARYNQALILEELGLRSAAVGAWETAAGLEPEPGWRIDIESQRTAASEHRSLAELWDQRSSASWETRLATVETTVDRFPWRAHRWLVESLLPRLARETLASGEPAELRAAVERLAARLAERGDPLGLDALEAWPAPDDRRRLGAIVALGAGLQHLEDLEVEAGRRALREAVSALGAGSHPLGLSAAVGLIVADFYDNTPAALERAERLVAGPARRYPALLGRILWLRGTLLGREGDYVASRDAYQRAASTLAPVYGPHPAGFLRVLAGEVSSLDGRLEESWQAFAEGLPPTLMAGSRRRIHAALFTVGVTLQEAGLERAARRVFAAAAANAERWGSTYGQAAALRGLASAERRLGEDERARVAIQRARAATASIADPVLRQLTRADLVVEEAELFLGERAPAPDGALVDLRDRLAEAVATYRRSGSSYDEVRGLLGLAGVLLAEGRAGLEPLERAQALLVDVRPAPIDRPGTVGVGLAEAAASRQALALFRSHDEAGALLAAERSRLLASGTGTTPAPDLIERLGELVVSTDSILLVLLGGAEPLVWTVSSSGLRVRQLTVDSGSLRRRAQALAAASPDERRRLLGELARVLLPADLEMAERYVFVADRDFTAIPFPALPHPANGEALVERGSVGRSPSLSFLLAIPASTKTGHALVVAAPAAAAAVPLPAAGEEAAAVAALLRGSRLLESPRRDDLLRHLQGAHIFHFSGHLKADPLAPYRQELLLGAAGENLSSGTILGLDLDPLELVVLSSCDSAAAGMGRLPGPSYADAFLLAGTREVVGTLWPIDDRSSLELMEDFWKAVAQGLSPLDALAIAARAARARDAWGSVGTPPVWMAYRIEGQVLRPAPRGGVPR